MNKNNNTTKNFEIPTEIKSRNTRSFNIPEELEKENRECLI